MNEDQLNEGKKLRALAAAGLLGYAGLHTPEGRHAMDHAKQLWAQASKPGHIELDDPTQPLPSEKNMSSWDLAQKYSERNADVADKLKGFTNTFITNRREVNEADSPFRKLMTRFFGVPGRPAAPAPALSAPSPQLGPTLVRSLDDIARNAQTKLNAFAESIKHKAIKNYLIGINFAQAPKIEFPHATVRPPPRRKRKPKPIPGPVAPVDYVIEAVVENWAKAAAELQTLVTETDTNIKNFVNNLIKQSGFTPTRTNTKAIADALKAGRFPGIDSTSARQIINKWTAVNAANTQLKQWLGLFQRTAQAQAARKKP